MGKNPPTQPQQYTAADIIVALEQTKGMISLAAKRLGCHPNTVRNYAKRYPSVAQALQEQREGFIDTAELALMNAVKKGEGWAIAFTLRTIGRNRGYVERQEHEHSGPGGGPIIFDYASSVAKIAQGSDADRDT